MSWPHLRRRVPFKKVGDLFNIVIDDSFYDSLFGLKDAKEVKAPSTVLMF